MGDSTLARQAGTYEAAAAMRATTPAENSPGSHPTSRISRNRASSQTLPTSASAPSAIPASAIFSPPPTTSVSRSRLTAPSAMRVPISTVR